MSPTKPALFLAFICMALAIESTVASAVRPCPIAYKCDTVEKVVWATDGSTCFVFRNNCHLLNENCLRQNRFEEVLKVVRSKECQLHCSDACLDVYKPVCAEYNGVERTFGNSCTLSNHICRTGETYSLARKGSCEGDSEI